MLARREVDQHRGAAGAAEAMRLHPAREHVAAHLILASLDPDVACLRVGEEVAVLGADGTVARHDRLLLQRPVVEADPDLAAMAAGSVCLQPLRGLVGTHVVLGCRCAAVPTAKG